MVLRFRSRRAEATECGTCTCACPMHTSAATGRQPLGPCTPQAPLKTRSCVPFIRPSGCQESPPAVHLDTTHSSCHHVRAECIIVLVLRHGVTSIGASNSAHKHPSMTMTNEGRYQHLCFRVSVVFAPLISHWSLLSCCNDQREVCVLSCCVVCVCARAGPPARGPRPRGALGPGRLGCGFGRWAVSFFHKRIP